MNERKQKFWRTTFTIGLILTGISSAQAVCEKVGESCEHQGFWNIYAAVPGGDAWGEDYAGTQEATVKLQNIAEAAMRALAPCGIKAEITNSSWVRGFRPDLVIVMSGPYSSKEAARKDVVAAKSCGADGYTKFGIWNEPGAE